MFHSFCMQCSPNQEVSNAVDGISSSTYVNSYYSFFAKGLFDNGSVAISAADFVTVNCGSEKQTENVS